MELKWAMYVNAENYILYDTLLKLQLCSKIKLLLPPTSENSQKAAQTFVDNLFMCRKFQLQHFFQCSCCSLPPSPPENVLGNATLAVMPTYNVTT